MQFKFINIFLLNKNNQKEFIKVMLKIIGF